MRARTVIYADEGKILTNGEIYGRQIFLAEGVSEKDFREIPEEEYEEIICKQTEENGEGSPDREII